MLRCNVRLCICIERASSFGGAPPGCATIEPVYLLTCLTMKISRRRWPSAARRRRPARHRRSRARPRTAGRSPSRPRAAQPGAPQAAHCHSHPIILIRRWGIIHWYFFFWRISKKMAEPPPRAPAARPPRGGVARRHAEALRRLGSRARPAGRRRRHRGGGGGAPSERRGGRPAERPQRQGAPPPCAPRAAPLSPGRHRTTLGLNRTELNEEQNSAPRAQPLPKEHTDACSSRAGLGAAGSLAHISEFAPRTDAIGHRSECRLGATRRRHSP